MVLPPKKDCKKGHLIVYRNGYWSNVQGDQMQNYECVRCHKWFEGTRKNWT